VLIADQKSVVVFSLSLSPSLSTENERGFDQHCTLVVVVVFSLSHLLPRHQEKTNNNEDEIRGWMS